MLGARRMLRQVLLCILIAMLVPGPVHASQEIVSVNELHAQADEQIQKARAQTDPHSASEHFAAAAVLYARTAAQIPETAADREVRNELLGKVVSSALEAQRLEKENLQPLRAAIDVVRTHIDALESAYGAGGAPPEYIEAQRRLTILRARLGPEPSPPPVVGDAPPTEAKPASLPVPITTNDPRDPVSSPTQPRTTTRPVPRWQLGLLPTLGTLAVVGASVALGLGVAIHRGKTRESSGYLYRDVYDAIAESGATVSAGDSLCTPTTRADPTVDGRCQRAILARNGMIASAVIGGLAVVGTAVLAGLIARHRRGERHGSMPGISVVWQASSVTARLQVRF